MRGKQNGGQRPPFSVKRRKPSRLTIHASRWTSAFTIHDSRLTLPDFGTPLVLLREHLLLAAIGDHPPHPRRRPLTQTTKNMKNIILALLLLLVAGSVPAQTRDQAADENTLLWRISGRDLKQPSYIFGTMHMLCATQIDLSDSLRDAIKRSEFVYLELDMENMQELMSIMGKMKMTGDTTLADLLSRSAYDSVKTFFTDKPGMIPFAMLEKFKPMLAASAIMEADMECANPVGMEQLIMVEARQQHVRVRGLETMAFQMSIFDSIPYRLQAQQLVDYVKNYGKGDSRKEFELMMQAYVNQQLNQLEDITKKENAGMEQYMDLLLYRRNVDWVAKMNNLMSEHPLVVAVGAGHLPGDRGVLSLLRKAGYTVEPVANNMLKKLEKNL